MYMNIPFGGKRRRAAAAQQQQHPLGPQNWQQAVAPHQPGPTPPGAPQPAQPAQAQQGQQGQQPVKERLGVPRRVVTIAGALGIGGLAVKGAFGGWGSGSDGDGGRSDSGSSPDDPSRSGNGQPEVDNAHLLGKKPDVVTAMDMEARNIVGRYTAAGTNRVVSSNRYQNSALTVEQAFDQGAIQTQHTCAFVMDVKVDFPLTGQARGSDVARGMIEIVGSAKGDSTEGRGSSFKLELRGAADGRGLLIGATELSSYFGGQFEYHWQNGPVGGYVRREGVHPMLSENSNFIGVPNGNLRIAVFQRKTKRELLGIDRLAPDELATVVAVLDEDNRVQTMFKVDNLGEFHGISGTVNGGKKNHSATLTLGSAVVADNVERSVFDRLTKTIGGSPQEAEATRQDKLGLLRGVGQQAAGRIAEQGVSREADRGLGL